MAAEPTFDQTLTTDGITVRLHRVGEKLTVELTDPTGALRQLHVNDVVTATTLAAINDLGTRTRTDSILEAMYRAAEELDEATINAVLAGMNAGDLPGWQAKESAWKAYTDDGGRAAWGEVFGQLRDIGIRRDIDAIAHLTPPFLAASLRHLVGSHGFTQNHYDAMTYSWRVFVGPIHAGDATPAEPVDVLALDASCVTLWDFATAEFSIDADQLDRLSAARPHFRDIRYTVARNRAEKLAKLLWLEPAWRQISALASRSLITLDRPRLDDAVAALNDAVLGLLLRRHIDNGVEFSQEDYDVLTGAWREQIGRLHPADADLHQPMS